MLSDEDCLSRARALLTDRVDPAFEVTGHKASPDHVVVAFTSEKSLDGVYPHVPFGHPVVIDRRTGEPAGDDIAVLAAEWPETVLPDLVAWWLAARPITLEPSVPARQVRAIDAIMTLRRRTGMSLVEAKRVVDRMLAEGKATIDLGEWRMLVPYPDGRRVALEVEGAPSEAGIRARVAGLPLRTALELADRPDPAAPPC